MKSLAHCQGVHSSLKRFARLPLATGIVSACDRRPARQQQQQQQIMAAPSPPPPAALQQAPSVTTTIDEYRIVSNIDTSRVPEDLKKNCILFFTPDTEPLARKIAAQGEHVVLGNIRWK